MGLVVILNSKFESMKRSSVLLYLILLLPSQLLYAQKDSSNAKQVVRVNLPAIIFRNISVEYERKLNFRHSLTLNIHVIPYGSLPFQSEAQKLIDKVYVDMNLAKVGSVGATASYRFYGRKGVFHGFYFAPMINYDSYKTALPIQYNNGKTGIFTGNINAVTAGVQLGYQCALARNIYLDLWIVGPSYGLSYGNLNFNGPLTINDQAILSGEIEDLRGSLPIYVISSYKVSASGASIVEQGPWAGLRGLGINVGFRF